MYSFQGDWPWKLELKGRCACQGGYAFSDGECFSRRLYNKGVRIGGDFNTLFVLIITRIISVIIQ